MTVNKTLPADVAFPAPGFFSRDSLFAQIARRLILVAFLFAALDAVVVLVVYVRDVEGLAQDLLTIQAEEIAEAVTFDGPTPHYVPSRLYREPIGTARLAFAIYDRQGRQIADDGPYALRRSIMPPITSVSAETRRDDLVTGFRLQGVRRLDAYSQPLWVSLVIEGSGLRPFWPAIRAELIDHVAVPLIPLFGLLLLFNVTAVRQTLMPLSNAVRDIETLDPRNIDRRLTVPQSPLEVRQLVSAVNGALDRIESAIRALRDFTADAAHELRTPLAIMMMQIEQLPSGPGKEKLTQDVAAMSRLVGQMLDMANADALIIPDDPLVELNDVAASVVHQLTPLALKMRREIKFEPADEIRIHGHAEALGRALRNLMENALAHTPEGTSVDVVVGPGPQVTVRDQGPGIPDGQRAQSLTRFWQGPRRQGAGAGLGLAIANRIAIAHGGRIEIMSPLGKGAAIRLVWDQPA